MQKRLPSFNQKKTIHQAGPTSDNSSPEVVNTGSEYKYLEFVQIIKPI